MFNLRSSVLVFTGFKSTQRAMLKEVSPVHCSHWPLKITFHQQNRASRFETIDQEFFVPCGETTEFNSEISHSLNHEPILVGIVHMMKLQFRIAPQQFSPKGRKCSIALPGSSGSSASCRIGIRKVCGSHGMPSAANRCMAAPFEEPIATIGYSRLG